MYQAQPSVKGHVYTFELSYPESYPGKLEKVLLPNIPFLTVIHRTKAQVNAQHNG